MPCLAGRRDTQRLQARQGWPVRTAQPSGSQVAPSSEPLSVLTIVQAQRVGGGRRLRRPDRPSDRPTRIWRGSGDRRLYGADQEPRHHTCACERGGPGARFRAMRRTRPPALAAVIGTAGWRQILQLRPSGHGAGIEWVRRHAVRHVRQAHSSCYPFSMWQRWLLNSQRLASSSASDSSRTSRA